MKSDNKSFWNEQQKRLQSLLKERADHKEIIRLFQTQHSMTHSSSISDERLWSFHDEVFENLSEEMFKTTIPKTKKSIAWHIWHTTRIEDITMNILVNNEVQILHRSRWHNRLNVSYVDTGNSMTVDEIQILSFKINCGALLEYRNEVGKTTQKIISSLKPEDLKRKIDKNLLKRIVSEKAVDKDSIWLIDFWGKKNVAGLLLMPATRHNMVHLNKSMEIKGKLIRSKGRLPVRRQLEKGL